MAPSVDSPIQTRLPLPVPDVILGSGRRPVGRQRIFVQTDTGSVLGIELDRWDNAQTVKKKLQTMLNVPTEQTALVFGDTVFKSDLSELRNDSPLLLTRHLQRSLSTPCIYPSTDVQMLVNGGQPFEVVGGMACCDTMKGIINDIVKGIQCGIEPVAASGGLGGAYYFRNCVGESVAVVKPTDEEPFAPNNPKGYVGRSLGQPGLKKAVRVGETGVREVAAYLLDHEQFAKVPPTVLVKVSHHAFHVNGASTGRKEPGKASSLVAKIASCQQFVYHDYDASDHGTSRFSVAAVHRIGILDIRIFNTDRHAGNILVRNTKTLDSRTSNVHVNESLDLVPIDHGLCLPEAFEDPYFEWLHWPQASLPFSEEELDYIKRLAEYKDADMLRRELPMLREACFRMLILSTTLLKKAAADGFCLAEIGEIMSRDGLEEASELELICMQAKIKVKEELEAEKLNECDACSEISVDEDLHEQFDFDDDDHQFRTSEDPYLWSSKECSSITTPPCYPFVPASNFTLPMPLPLQNDTKCQYASQSHLSILHEFSQDVEHEDSCMPFFRSSESRTNISGTESLSLQRLSLRGISDTRFPRSNQGPKVRASFCPLVEESEVVDFPEYNTRSSVSSRKAGCQSLQAMSYKSVSFSSRKQRYKDYTNRITPVSEIVGKVNVKGGMPLSLGDMNEKEWACFMYHFKEELEEALATRRNWNTSHRQRLGISCRF